MLAPLALALLHVAAVPRTVVVMQVEGLSDTDARALSDQIDTEVSAAGVELLGRAVAITSDCARDRACARTAVRDADTDFVVLVDATRAGLQVQIEAVLLDRDGIAVAEGEAVGKLDELVAATALPDSIGRALRQSATAATDSLLQSLVPQRLPAGSAGGASATGEPPPLVWAGIAALGVGGALTVGSTLIASVELGVIHDAASLGAEKESAATMATSMLVVMGTGLAVCATGGVLLYAGLAE